MNNKIYLCSFASNDLNKSVERFTKQAEKMGVYEDIKIFRPSDLDHTIFDRIQNIIKLKGHYLYGHAIWKPHIVNKYMQTISKNSIIHYSDIGCHLNYKGIKRFSEYIKLTKKNNMLTFGYSSAPSEFKNYNYNFQVYNEYHFTKTDVLKHFELDLNSEISKSHHLWSGSFFMKKSDLSEKVLNEWNECCNFINLLDNSPSQIQNHKDHIGMRGEQSLFSIICKINKVKSISVSECEWAEAKDGTGRKWDHLDNYPILAKRDLKYGIFKRFFNRQKKNYRRLKKKIFNN